MAPRLFGPTPEEIMRARNAERAGEHIGYTEVSAAEALRTLRMRVDERFGTARAAFEAAAAHQGAARAPDSITPPALLALLHFFGINVREAELAKVFAVFDASGDGSIAFDEFQRYIGSLRDDL